jgi:site-specific recombinase XerD
MSDYDDRVEQIRLENQPILDGFEQALEQASLSIKTVRNHVGNIQFFAEYLFYYDPLRPLNEAEEGDISSFLLSWFPRKAVWASEDNVKQYLTSFRKFFRYMVETNQMTSEQEAEIQETLTEGKEEFLDAVSLNR